MIRVWEDPFVASFRAGIAVAFDKTLQLGNLNIELEGSAVAVT
jgi:hypothetical protein